MKKAFIAAAMGAAVHAESQPASFELPQINFEDIFNNLYSMFIAFIQAFPTHDQLPFAHQYEYDEFEMDMMVDAAIKRTFGIRRKLGMSKLGEGENGNVVQTLAN